MNTHSNTELYIDPQTTTGKKRGRKPLGDEAMSAAQRMRLYRLRSRESKVVRQVTLDLSVDEQLQSICYEHGLTPSQAVTKAIAVEYMFMQARSRTKSKK